MMATGLDTVDRENHEWVQAFIEIMEVSNDTFLVFKLGHSLTVISSKWLSRNTVRSPLARTPDLRNTPKNLSHLTL